MPALDAKQKALAKRILEFRDRMLQQQETRNEDRQLKKVLTSYTSLLRSLQDAAYKMRKYDARLFQDVLTVIRSLQGNIDDNNSTARPPTPTARR